MNLQEQKKEIENSTQFFEDQEVLLLAELRKVIDDAKRVKEKLSELRITLNDKVQQRKHLQNLLKKATDECDRKLYSVEKLSTELAPKSSHYNATSSTAHSLVRKRTMIFNNFSNQFADQIMAIKQDNDTQTNAIRASIHELGMAEWGTCFIPLRE